MSSETAKHLSWQALLIQAKSMQKRVSEMQQQLDRFVANFEAMQNEAPLGKTAKMADRAYEIIKQKGRFTSFDCAKLGIFDTTRKKRLFSALTERHPDVKAANRQQQGDRRKIIVALLDEKQEEGLEKARQEMKEFIKVNNPTREQLVKRFGWSEEEAKKQIGRLVAARKICWSDSTDKYKWIGEE